MRRIVRLSVGRRGVARDVESELRFHLEMRAREFEAAGLSPAEAKRAAERAFGNAEAIAAECGAIRRRRDRERRRRLGMDAVWRDVLYAVRLVGRARGYAVAVVLTMALGIGATGAAFSVVRGVLLAPLPLADPDRLVRVTESVAERSEDDTGISLPALRDLRAESRTMESVAGWRLTEVRVRKGDAVELVLLAQVTPNLLSTLGVRPALGRVPATREEGVLVSHGYWLRALGGAADAVGATVSIEGSPVPVAGVMPPWFDLPSEVELWAADGPAQAWMENRAVHVYGAVGRLAAGATSAQAASELTVRLERAQAAEGGTDPGHRVSVTPLREAIVGDARPALLALFGAVLVVLGIGIATVAGLQIARGAARRGEMAVRAALGAGRLAVVRQLLIENLVLAVLGGAAGVLLALTGARWLVLHLPPGVPRLDEVRVDAVVLGFMLLAVTLATLAAGLPPALDAARVGAIDGLKGTLSRATSGRARPRRVLLGLQMALTVVLVVGAGLLLRSFVRLQSTDPGFDPDRLVHVTVSAPADAYPETADVVEFYRTLPAVLSGPAFEIVSAVNVLPVSGGDSNGQITVEGAPFEGAPPGATYRRVLPNYFEAAGIPLLEGRVFDERDRGDGPAVVVINEMFAQRLFPGGEAIGRRIKVGPPENEPWLTVVGVVGDVRNERLEVIDEYATYEPHPQRPWRTMVVVARARSDPAAAVRALHDALRAHDDRLLIYDAGTMRDRIAMSLAPRQFNARVVAGFGLAALLLAVFGIYGLTAYAVARRRRELGVRIALGAQPREVVALALRDGASSALIGAGVGILLAFAGARWIASLLYGIPPVDPVTFAAVLVVLPAVALLAAWLPARRAARVDPVEAMRPD